jgi:hypothetical protein
MERPRLAMSDRREAPDLQKRETGQRRGIAGEHLRDDLRALKK